MNKSILAGALTGALLFCATPVLASSVLEDRGGTTFDPVTNLEWLDITATLGQSYDSVAGGYGNYTTTGNYHFATRDELVGFFTDAGGGNTYPNVDFANTVGDATYNAVTNLLTLLGMTYQSSTDMKAYGLTAGMSGGAHATAFIDRSDDLADSPPIYIAALFPEFNDSQLGTYTDEHMGSFLVRASAPIAPTPLPAALPLFASALAGLGAVAHRRRKSGR